MLLQIDSTAVAHAGQVVAGALAAWVLRTFPGLPDNVAQLLTAGIASGFGLLVAWGWGLAHNLAHSNSAQSAQDGIAKWWANYGGWLGTLIAALIAAGASGNWLAALLPILAHTPPAILQGAGKALTSQAAANVSKGRVGALVLLIAGASMLCAPGRSAANVSVLAQPKDVSGLALPWLSIHRFVGTAAVGEGWTGPQATDHPTPFGRLGVGYQAAAPIQLNAGFRRQLVTGSTWRPEIEVRFIWAP